MPIYATLCHSMLLLGDAHTLLHGSGSSIALMVAGLITSARGPLGKFETWLTGCATNHEVNDFELVYHLVKMFNQFGAGMK